MSLSIGSKIPKITLKHLVDGSPTDIVTDDLLAGKKVVIFGVPGAYTPTCSKQHLPGFVDRATEFAGKGIHLIACIAVNDPFVLDAWAEAGKVGSKVKMLSDGNGEFTRAMGLEADFSGAGMGMRMNRCAMLIENGVLKILEVDKNGSIDLSSAEAFVCKI